MNKIPSARDHWMHHKNITYHSRGWYDNDNHIVLKEKDLNNLLIEFAQQHTENALESAANKAKITTVSDGGWNGTDNNGWKLSNHDSKVIDKKSIINAYPLTNIK